MSLKLQLALLLCCLSLSSLSNAVSISYSGGVYNLTNFYASYYVNSSGFQISNVPNEFWSHNLVCIKLDVAGIPERCVDTVPFVWTNYTNGNFAQLNGTVSWLFAVGRNVTVKTEYYLDDVDPRIKMNMSIRYVGSRNITGQLIWRVHDISVGGDAANDKIYLNMNETNTTYYLLNTTGLNWSYSSLYEGKYILGDSEPGGGSASTYWDDAVYNLTVIKGSEPNAVVDLRRPFSLLTGQTANFGLRWSDPVCSLAACNLNNPTNATTYINECGSFLMKSSLGAVIGDPAVCVNGWIQLQYNTLLGGYVMLPKYYGNLSCNGYICEGTVDVAPPNNWFADYVMGVDYKTADYTIRGACYVVDSGWVYSKTKAIRVNESFHNPNVTINLPVNNSNVAPGLMQINATVSDCRMYGGNMSFKIGNATANATHEILMSNNTSWIPWGFNYSYFDTSEWGLLPGHSYNITANATNFRKRSNYTVWHIFTISSAAIKQIMDEVVYRHRLPNYIYLASLLVFPLIVLVYKKKS